MNAAWRTRAGFLVACALHAAVCVAFAASTPAPPAPKSSSSKTAAPATVSDEAAFAPCVACHGAQGEGLAAAHVPRLAGQAAEYLQKQLHNYADGTRDSPIMTNFAKALSETQRAKFAARYASMSAPFLAEAAPVNAVMLARGHQLAYQGDETKRVQACVGCHGPDGIGVPHAAPYLAGQSAEYLAGALKAFQQGTRKNDAGQLMRSVAQRLDDADIAAVTGYFAGLSSSTHQSATPW
ncbi:MAG: c-type cytochrome [Gammaproteobacteria bacterium]